MATLRVPEVVPSPAQDAETLRNAVQGLGTDEKAIILILGQRNASQRRKIKDAYQQLYKESLINSLFDELSGDFRKAVMLWTYDPPERDARLANEVLKAKKKGIKQLQIIVEIACASSPHHLQAVRQSYCSLYDCSLEEEIVESGIALPLRKLLVGLVSSYRYDQEVVDANLANSEAEKLHESIKRKQLDHDDLVFILSIRNLYQLRETFQSYHKKFGTNIDQDIKKYGSGDLQSLLRVVICCLETPEKHFAKVIGDAVIGLGTDEDSLTRAIVSRAEIDLMKVRGEYFNLYKTNLDAAVADDTSGDYYHFLMTLLGAKI